MGDSAGRKSSELEQALLAEKLLTIRRKFPGEDSLMMSLSFSLYLNENFFRDVQSECVNYFRRHPEFCRFRMKTQMEYQMSPALSEFDTINIKIFAMLYQRKVRVFFLHESAVHSNSFNQTAAKKIYLFRTAAGQYYCLESLAQRALWKLCRGLVLGVADAFLEADFNGRPGTRPGRAEVSDSAELDLSPLESFETSRAAEDSVSLPNVFNSEKELIADFGWRSQSQSLVLKRQPTPTAPDSLQVKSKPLDSQPTPRPLDFHKPVVQKPPDRKELKSNQTVSTDSQTKSSSDNKYFRGELAAAPAKPRSRLIEYLMAGELARPAEPAPCQPKAEPKPAESESGCTGYVKSFDEEQGYGFIAITSAGGGEVFVHRSQLERAGLSTGRLRALRRGERIAVAFAISYYESKKHGPSRKAFNVRAL